MKRLFRLLLFGLFATSIVLVYAQTPPPYTVQGTVNVAPTTPKLTAVDPFAYAVNNDVMPTRPFLYTVDKNGITITRFNDNQVVGTWPWPKDVIYTVTPNGSYLGLIPPAEWEPVAMTVSYPTLIEMGNRGMTPTGALKPIPDLTPPWTFVYVVMAHSGYEWKSTYGFRDTIVRSTNPATESSMLIQIDVSDPSFSQSTAATQPVDPHVAAALLGHGAGQPVYNRADGTVYIANMPSNGLPTALSSFVSVINRIPPTVTAEEREIPGVAIPVIRCGPQHPEQGIPVGRPQAYACYDPSGLHPINDNEHVGASGTYAWEFRNLPAWLTPHRDKVTGEFDGILYGTPPTTGEWYAEARVHNLDDEWGAWSYWTPVRLLVTPTAEYLPVRVQFAAGVPVAYQLEGTGSCNLVGAPSWVDVATVPNGCIVMGRAPIDGEYYNFTMPGLSVTGYPGLSLVFSGNVFGQYNFVPLPTGVGLSGLAFHQISMVADPSTETAVLSLEFVGVEPGTGQLYRILAPPGRPQPPNERPPETALTLDVVTPEGAPLLPALRAARSDIAGVLGAYPNLKVKFGNMAVEADRDIFVAATEIYDPTGAAAPIPIGGATSGDDGALIKVSGGAPTVITLPGVQACSLDLDSDLRPAIIGVDPGQVDHGTLFVTGTTTGNAAVIDTTAGTVSQTLPVAAGPLGNISVDFGTRFAYTALEAALSVAILTPQGATRPPMQPRVWSYNESTFSLGYTAPQPFKIMATGDGIPTLSLIGELPAGITFTDLGGGFAQLTGTPEVAGEFALTLVAEGSSGTYAQAFGVTVYEPATITSANTATFIAGSASAFMVTVQPTTAILYTWDQEQLPPGVQLIDNENGTASLIGIPTQAGTYTFTIGATTFYPVDAEQEFTLIVEPAGTTMAPVFTNPNTATWEAVGAPFAPDPVTIATIGSPRPTLTIVAGTLPTGVTFVDNNDSTATLGGNCVINWPGMAAECLGLLPEGSEGTYNFTIRAQNSVGYVDQAFTLILEPNSTLLSSAPATLSFAHIIGGEPPAPQSATISSTDVLPVAVVTTAPWLVATPKSGMTPANLSISVDPTGLVAGTYTATVMAGSAGTEGPFATVSVTLTVTDPPAPGMMAIAPATMSFASPKNEPPGPQSLSVVFGGGAVNYTAAASVPWIKATPLNGFTPGRLNISVDPSTLGAGSTSGTVSIAIPGATNSPLAVTVSVIKGGASDNVKLYYNVGSGPEGMAINLKTHHLFINSSNEPPAAPENESAVEVETPMGPAIGSAVFHFDPASGLTIMPILVHGEGEYVAVNSKTGRVYQASQNTGEVVVIDGLHNNVITYIPLMLSEGVYQPFQIAIDEEQNFIYVGAKAPLIVDPAKIKGAPFPCKAIHEMPDDEYDCWTPGKVFVIDGKTNKVVSWFLAGDDPEGVAFAAATGKVYASNEDDGSITVAKGAVRNRNGSITSPKVIATIVGGLARPGWWEPKCDKKNYCGERGQAALWPEPSACRGIDVEAEEADKMAVDDEGNVYIIDDRYRVAKINGRSDRVTKVLGIEGFDCALSVTDGSPVIFRNTANNIAFMNTATKHGRLYVTSEQDTVTLIDPVTMKIETTIRIPGAAHLDAIATDPQMNRVFITDEILSALWVLSGRCANGTPGGCEK